MVGVAYQPRSRQIIQAMSKNHRISSIASRRSGLVIFRGGDERVYSSYFHPRRLMRIMRIIEQRPDDFYVQLLFDGWQAYRIRGDEEA